MGKVQDSILRVYENMTAVERSIADFFMSNEEPMDFSSRNVAGMISSGEIDPELQKSSCRDDSRREMHPDLAGLQESRENQRKAL